MKRFIFRDLQHKMIVQTGTGLWHIHMRNCTPWRGLPRWLMVKMCVPVGDTGGAGLMIPGLGRSSGGGNGNPLHYSCLENSVDRGAWWPTVHRVTKSRTQSTHQPTYSTKNDTLGLPWWLGVKEFTCQCRRHGLDPWYRKILQSS